MARQAPGATGTAPDAPSTDTHHHTAADEQVAAAELTEDARIAAVLAVLRGAPIEATARQWSIDPTLLQRWVEAFVDAGTAQVNNRPDPRAAQHRDRFLAAFAFEMRTPLTMARGWADLLAGADVGDPEAAAGFLETAARLDAALSDLAARVDDAELLVAAALGGLQVEQQPVTIGELCAGIEGLEPAAVRGKGPELEVHVDPRLFGRILLDLWDAAALDPAPRSRTLWVNVVGPWVDVRVMRAGDPIDTDLLQTLFEPFAAEHLSSGITIGLYLARALTVAHGGTVGIDQDDAGAALWVRVPHRPDTSSGSAPTRGSSATTSGGQR